MSVTLELVLAHSSPALSRRERVAARGRAGLRALERSAALAGAPRAWAAPLERARLPRDLDGAPLERDGWHWSLADTTGLAAGLVAPLPAALDAEWLGRPRWHAARERFRASGELERLGADERSGVLQLWTAKEALLKLRRVGIADLERCRLIAREDAETLVLLHAGRETRVRVVERGEHVVALACAVPCALRFTELLPEPASAEALA